MEPVAEPASSFAGLLRQLRSEARRRTGAMQQARAHCGEALAIARDLGAPLQEARALEGTGRSLLDCDPAEAASCLRQALEIYRRIGVPAARQVQDTLTARGLL